MACDDTLLNSIDCICIILKIRWVIPWKNKCSEECLVPQTLIRWHYHYEAKSPVRSQPGILRCESGKSTKPSLCDSSLSKPRINHKKKLIGKSGKQKTASSLRKCSEYSERRGLDWTTCPRASVNGWLAVSLCITVSRTSGTDVQREKGLQSLFRSPLKTVECWVREGHSAAKAKIWTFSWAGESSL